MSKSLIRKNQLSADISDLVGEYGSGFFIGINSSGHLINSLAEVVSGDFRNIVRTTGEQNISGVKTFASRPTVNGTGVLLSGEASELPNTILYTTGNQNISGQKRFIDNDVVQRYPPSIFIGGFGGPGIYDFVSRPEYRQIVYPYPNYYYSGIGTTGIYHVQIYFNTGTSRWWYTYNGILQDASPVVHPDSLSASLPLNNWSGGNMKIVPTYPHNISHYVDGNDPIDPNRINAVALTGNQAISGVKTFASRPTVNGTGFFLSGDSFVAPNFNSAPINPVMGQIYFDTNSNNFSGYNGTAWTRLNN